MSRIIIMSSSFRVTAKGPDPHRTVKIVNRTQYSYRQDSGQPIRICLIYLTKRNEAG